MQRSNLPKIRELLTGQNSSADHLASDPAFSIIPLYHCEKTEHLYKVALLAQVSLGS